MASLKANLTSVEKANLVLLALKAGGFNPAINADDIFGGEGERGVDNLLGTPNGKNRDGVDLMIMIFKNAGYNPKLEVGGWVGPELRRAVANFRKEMTNLG